jgi:CheY-like chemotaxis protein
VGAPGCVSRRRLDTCASVLVVERDPTLRLLLGAALGRAGTLYAASRAEAIDLLAATRPRILLLDGDMRGWRDVLSAARLVYGPDLPIILTGTADRGAEAARCLGATSYLRKPLLRPDALREIASLIANRRRA